jgi:hypothetical protein
VLKYAVDCKRQQAHILSVTRDAICTHMVDGFYFLWVVQAVAGIFLVCALIVLKLVQESFHHKDRKHCGKSPDHCADTVKPPIAASAVSLEIVTMGATDSTAVVQTRPVEQSGVV